jgi:hypothetical protein
MCSNTSFLGHNHLVEIWNAVGEHGWAGIVYLDPAAPVAGGRHLWRNRDPRRRYDWMAAASDWELIDSFGNIFNRLALMCGSVPRSGGAGRGDRNENDRRYRGMRCLLIRT